MHILRVTAAEVRLYLPTSQQRFRSRTCIAPVQTISQVRDSQCNQEHIEHKRSTEATIFVCEKSWADINQFRTRVLSGGMFTAFCVLRMVQHCSAGSQALLAERHIYFLSTPPMNILVINSIGKNRNIVIFLLCGYLVFYTHIIGDIIITTWK